MCRIDITKSSFINCSSSADDAGTMEQKNMGFHVKRFDCCLKMSVKFAENPLHFVKFPCFLYL